MSSEDFRTLPRNTCYLCGSVGQIVYHALKDVRYGCPGLWNIRICSSRQCGLLWLDPVPVDADIPLLYRYFRETHEDVIASSGRLRARFRGQITPAYLARKYGYFPAGNERNVHRLLGLLAYLRPNRRADANFPWEHLANAPKGRLLDIGCGGGAMMKAMQEWGWEVEGVDFDPEAISNAKKKGLTVYLGSLESQVFDENSFDAVIMSHVIEHVPDPIRFLQEAYRILKPGGRIVLATPNARSLGHRLWKQAWISLAIPYHLFLFTPSSLTMIANKAGFLSIKASSKPKWVQESFIASMAVYSTGWFERSAYQPLSHRLFGSFMAGLESLFVHVGRNLGEEVVMTGIK